MSTKRWWASWRRPADKLSNTLPPGVRLLRILDGHQNSVRSVAFHPDGGTLASGSYDNTLKIWETGSGKPLLTLEGHGSPVVGAFDPRGGTLASGSLDHTIMLWQTRSGKLLRTVEGHTGSVFCVAFHPHVGTLASGSEDGTVKLWDPKSGELLRTLEGHRDSVGSVAFHPQGGTLASGSDDYTVKLWEVGSGEPLFTLEGHQNFVCGVAFHPHGGPLVSGSFDNTVKLWDAGSGKLLRTLEGHTDGIDCVAVSLDGRLVASKSRDHTIRLWSCETWETVAIIPEPTERYSWHPALAFHPTLPLLATAGLEARELAGEGVCRTIHLWELDLDVMLGQRTMAPASFAVHHTTGKIVLVGDHSVGKSALAYRLIHGAFKEHASTHGQQFWVFPTLGMQRPDGTDCEAILWDLAGQPDYRMVNALFVDDADLALVLFDASDIRDPLHGVRFWLKQLQTGDRRCPIILVAAQTDRGAPSLTSEELSAFCQKHEIAGPITTSAFTGVGIEALVEQMKSLIAWEEKSATVTTTTFKRIKDYVLELKEKNHDGQTIVTPRELRARLQAIDAGWQFTDTEMLTALGHLENYGYVKRLRTSKGERRVLLRPERLNNLASSFVLEARRNPRGLGALEERRLLTGGYEFPDAWGVPEHERWVEKRLATDLQKAGVDVVLDRWHNSQIGVSVARFVERIEKSDRIVTIGTPLYRWKYDNKDSSTGYVVAAEVDLINNRLLGTESQKESVLPLLLAGEKTASLPPLLHGRVHADFRDESAYFTTTFDLILSLYQLLPNHPAVADLRESLHGPQLK
jgi:small GTP-binding protein